MSYDPHGERAMRRSMLAIMMVAVVVLIAASTGCGSTPEPAPPTPYADTLAAIADEQAQALEALERGDTSEAGVLTRSVLADLRFLSDYLRRLDELLQHLVDYAIPD